MSADAVGAGATAVEWLPAALSVRRRRDGLAVLAAGVSENTQHHCLSCHIMPGTGATHDRRATKLRISHLQRYCVQAMLIVLALWLVEV
jgi:hypothetical protein